MYIARQAIILKFNGKNFATLIGASQLRDIESLQGGQAKHLDLNSIPENECAQCIGEGWDLEGDDSPCWDCSGPLLGPSYEILCFDSFDCGDDGGIGIFRLPDPLITCYYSFATGDNNCDFMSAFSGWFPKDVSGAYFYSTGDSAMEQPHQELHCGNPGNDTQQYEVLAAGFYPGVPLVHLGWSSIKGNQPTTFAMSTTHATGTGITATFSLTGAILWYGAAYCAGTD